MLKGYETKDYKKNILNKNEPNPAEHKVKRTAEKEGFLYVQLEGSESGKKPDLSTRTEEIA